MQTTLCFLCLGLLLLSCLGRAVTSKTFLEVSTAWESDGRAGWKPPQRVCPKPNTSPQKNRRPAQSQWSSFSPSSKAGDFQHGRTNEQASYLPHLPEALSHDILIPLRQEQAARGGFIAPTQCGHNLSTLCTLSRMEKINTSNHG